LIELSGEAPVRHRAGNLDFTSGIALAHTRRQWLPIPISATAFTTPWRRQ